MLEPKRRIGWYRKLPIYSRYSVDRFFRTRIERYGPDLLARLRKHNNAKICNMRNERSTKLFECFFRVERGGKPGTGGSKKVDPLFSDPTSVHFCLRFTRQSCLMYRE